jgi:hypothetical protein
VKSASELVTMGCPEVLGVLQKVFVCSLTRDLAQGKLAEARESRSSGHAYDNNGSLGFIEFTAADHSREIAHMEAIVQVIEDYCEVTPAYGPESPHPVLVGLKEFVSEEEYAALMLTAEHGGVLVTVDGHLRQWAVAAQLQGIWPQVLLMHAAAVGHITQPTYAVATVKMFMANRGFISLRAFDLLMMCHQGDNWLKFGVGRYARYLADPGTDFKLAFEISLEFFQLVAKLLSQFGVLGELVKHVVEGLIRHKDCWPNVMEKLDEFFEQLFRRDSLTLHYQPAAETAKNRETTYIKCLQEFARSGQVWAQEAVQERDIKVKVLMIGTTPWLIYR